MPSGIYKHHSNQGFQKGNKIGETNKGQPNLKIRGENNGRWKCGRIKRNGYLFIYKPEHPNAYKNYVRRSHLVAEKYLGRYLTKIEIIHHINEIRNDDRPENLYLFATNGKHKSYHNLKIKSILMSNIFIS